MPSQGILVVFVKALILFGEGGLWRVHIHVKDLIKRAYDDHFKGGLGSLSRELQGAYLEASYHSKELL